MDNNINTRIIVCVTNDILLKKRINFTNSSDIIFNFLY